MGSQRHIIQRQTVELSIARQQDAWGLQQEASRIMRKAQALIERCCDELCPPDRLHRIERLELDLGTLDLTRLEEELLGRFGPVLREALAEHINRQEDSAIPPKTASDLELLAQFARQGSLPWWADLAQPAQPQTSLDRLLRDSPALLQGLMAELAADSQALYRLAGQFDEQGLAKLVSLRLPALADFPSELGLALQALPGHWQALEGIPSRRFRRRVWQAMLQCAFQPTPPEPNPLAFGCDVALRLARLLAIPASGLLQALAEAAAAGRLQGTARETAAALATQIDLQTTPAWSRSSAERFARQFPNRIYGSGASGTTPTEQVSTRSNDKAEGKIKTEAGSQPAIPGKDSSNPSTEAGQFDVGPVVSRQFDQPSQSDAESLSSQTHPKDPALTSRNDPKLQTEAMAIPDDPSSHQARSSAKAFNGQDNPQDLASTDAPAHLTGLQIPSEAPADAADASEEQNGLQIQSDPTTLPHSISLQRTAKAIVLPSQPAARNQTSAKAENPPGTPPSQPRGLGRREIFEDLPVSGLSEAEQLYLANAGLVILWPFLGTFFTRLGLVEEDRFTGEAARQRGLALLHYLASADPAPSEYWLPLNKLLCGMALEAVFELDEALTDAETAECEALLEAVIEQAPVLNHMSVRGFRGSFLLRAGVLSVQDGGWLLRVERETYDLVLDRFPWGFEWVRLPWMETPLRVEW